MTRSTSLIVTAGIALAILFAYFNSSTVQGQQKNSNAVAAASDNDDIFKDKILLLEVMPSDAEGSSNSVVIDNARTAKLGSRDFVVGDGYAPEGSDDAWYDDMLVGVPCENIVRFQSMTPERFKEYMKMWKDHEKEL
jgi:hypothetical protein